MHMCTWIGFAGYIFAFLFFLLGILAMAYMAYDAYKIGKSKGWLFLLNKDDFIRKNPLNFLLVTLIALPLGIYYFLYNIAFIILPPYWKCLMG